MNAPFKSDPIQEVLAEACVSISDLKKNPAAVVAEAQNRQVAILSRNKPVAYVVSPEVWEHVCSVFEDRADERAAREALEEEGEDVEVDFDDL